MNFKEFYFSTKGRLGRLDFFLKFYLPFLLILSTSIYFEGDDDYYSTIAFLLLLWPYFATLTKRFHDFGKSGRFMFFIYNLLCGTLVTIPISAIFLVDFLAFEIVVGAVILGIIVWLMVPVLIPGTKGENKYGMPV